MWKGWQLLWLTVITHTIIQTTSAAALPVQHCVVDTRAGVSS